MKQKKSTYFLAFCVIIIWGLIVYRIADTVSGEDEVVYTFSPAKKPVFKDYTISEDTTKLMLNYRDPFRLSKLPDTAKKQRSIKLETTGVVAQKKPVIDWNFIRYAGYVANPGQKKILSLILINGKSVMLAEGELSDNVKLIKNMKDSVKISYNNKIKIITRSSGS